jgi:phage baseplate assembly protein V
MLRFGNISSINAADGLYKVTFDEDKLVSAWLPYLVKNTKSNKDENPFDINEHVACLMDENIENGVILGATNTNSDKPVAGNADIRRTTYKDGSYVEFNRSISKLTISCEGDVQIIKSANVNVKASTKILLDCSDVEINGSLKVSQDITSTTGNITATTGDVKALTHSLSSHIHSGVTIGSGVTGTPTP